jgi:transcriptional regulator with XRE-family HTH domain
MKINKAILKQLGTNIKNARLRRNLSMQEIAERAAISIPTLRAVESGSPNTSIGIYLQTLTVLGLDKDLARVAYKDELGQNLMDAKLGNRIKRG